VLAEVSSFGLAESESEVGFVESGFVSAEPEVSLGSFGLLESDVLS
jgi:hypothetical protein